MAKKQTGHCKRRNNYKKHGGGWRKGPLYVVRTPEGKVNDAKVEEVCLPIEKKKKPEG